MVIILSSSLLHGHCNEEKGGAGDNYDWNGSYSHAVSQVGDWVGGDGDQAERGLAKHTDIFG